MLRALSSSLLLRKPFGVRLFSTEISNANKIDAATLLQVADSLMSSGKVKTAEDIYRNAIDVYPNCKEAYQKLWSSWITHRSLKVTEKELNDFIAKYEKYIDPTHESLPPMQPPTNLIKP